MSDAPGAPPNRATDAASDALQPLLARAQTLADELSAGFKAQVKRSLGVDLDDSETSLAFVDYHLATARDEQRDAIVGLLAAGAGAYYGELVRRIVGGTWIGDGRDPRRLRLLLHPQFLYFAPVDQALEAIAGDSLDPDDPRIPPGPPVDATFHLEPVAPGQEDDETHDAVWLQSRLSELSPVPADEFHCLTCRFETLTLMLGLLASKHVAEGRAPGNYGVEHYLDIISRPH